MKRIHRTLWDRFSYMAVYQCRKCHAEESVPRHFRFHLGVDCRCPKCGTVRLRKLRERDHIDPMMTGMMNLMERLAGGTLYHCRYCRVQFYDRRIMKPPVTGVPQPIATDEIITPPDTASSGA